MCTVRDACCHLCRQSVVKAFLGRVPEVYDSNCVLCQITPELQSWDLDFNFL